MLKLDERFWNKVEVIPFTTCWEWVAGKDWDGYGHFKITINGKKCTRKSHRLAFENRFGPIPKGMLICHTCDNPGCVNPDHLFIGTPKDNNNDAVKKGRYKAPSGQKHWTKKVKQIRDKSGRFSK